MSRSRDAGQAALVVVVATLVLMAAVVLGAASLGRTTTDRARARTAADAAALAALEGGRAAAVELAVANGAELVSWARGPGPHDVTVVVAVGDVRATARASNAP